MINIYDQRDKNLNLRELTCLGHPDVKDFQQECKRQFGIIPIRVVQKWQREISVYSTDDKGRKTLKTTIENCQQSHDGAQALTIGFVDG